MTDSSQSKTKNGQEYLFQGRNEYSSINLKRKVKLKLK